MAGKSLGQTIGGVGGAVVGGVIGFFASGGNPMGAFIGASVGAQLGTAVGGMVDPPDSGNIQEQSGPIGFRVNMAHRNLAVPIAYGIVRLGGNIIWMGNVRTRVEESGGGKGKPKIRKVFYNATWALALSEGPIAEVGRVWVNEQEVKKLTASGKQELVTTSVFTKNAVRSTGWSPTPGDVLGTIQAGGTVSLTLGEQDIVLDATIYPGNQTQTPDSRIGGANPPAFRNTAYFLLDGQVGQRPGLPMVSVEIAGIAAQIQNITQNVRFFRWQDPAAFTLNAVGTINHYEGYHWWIRDFERDANKNFAAHRALDTEVDAKGDWTLQFYICAKYTALRDNVAQVGIAFLTAVDNVFQDFTLDGVGFIVGGPGYAWVLGGTGDYYQSASQDLYRILDAEEDIRGFPTEVGFWQRIRFTAATREFTWEYLRTKFVPTQLEHPVILDDDWQVLVQRTLSQSEFDNLPTDPLRLAVYADGFPVTPWTSTTPSCFISHLTFIYTSTSPVQMIAVHQGNPALIVYDFLTNTRYGMGLPSSVIDVDAFVQAANYCDEDPNAALGPAEPSPAGFNPTCGVVPDLLEFGNPRFRLDLVVSGRKQAADILQEMLACFRGFLFIDAGKVHLGIEKFEAATAVFADDPQLVPLKGLIVEDSLEWTEIPSNDRPNYVRIEYERMDDQYREDFVFHNDPFDQVARGKVEKTLRLLGIKRLNQAKRMAQYFVDLGVHQRFRCRFKVSLASMAVRVADVISVSHADPGWTNKLFRIVRIDELEHEELQLECIEYVPDIYVDAEIDYDIPPTALIAGDLYVDLPNAVRVQAFEPRDDAQARVYVTWSLPTWYQSFLDAFLFRRRGTTGTFESLGHAIVDAVTARVTHMRIGFDPVTEATTPGLQVIEIVGDVVGGSAKVFDDLDQVLASAVESGGKISLDVSLQANPVTGSLQVYVDGAFAVPAPGGRFPNTGSTSLFHDVQHTYRRTPFGAYADQPTEILVRNLLGAMPSTGDVQLGKREGAFTGFASDDDADRLSGVTWPLEPASEPVKGSELENRVTDFKVYQRESGAFVERTTEFTTDQASGATLFPGSADKLFIGSASQTIAALFFALQQLPDVGYGTELYYSVGDNTWHLLTEGQDWKDGTLGFTKSGVVEWDPLVDWELTSQWNGETIGDGTPRYYIMLNPTVAPATKAIERVLHCEGETFLTVQDESNRVDYFYDDDDLNTVLRFEPMMQNILGGVADVAKRPGADLTIQQHALKPRPVDGLRMQAPDDPAAVFLGGDLTLTWSYVSKVNGAGRDGEGAGNLLEGAGLPAITDPSFQRYILEVWTPDGAELVRAVSVADVDGIGAYTYTEADRHADGTVGLAMQVIVYQQANGLRSDPAILDVVQGRISLVKNIGELPGFGTVQAPRVSEIDMPISQLPLPVSDGVGSPP